jgi:hypothetical protein
MALAPGETFVPNAVFRGYLQAVWPVNARLLGARMVGELDEAFYKRADAHIHLANDQVEEVSHEMVNASLLFAAARFSAFTSARGFSSGQAMEAKRAETIDYFVAGFRQMLEGNLDAYVKNFDTYLKGDD